MRKPEGISHNDWKLLQLKYRNLSGVVRKIENNYPVQYLIGHVEFYGNKIYISEGVFIPRFETETLVEKTFSYLNQLALETGSVLEIGSGSGCISITLKSEVTSLEITAIERSRKAVRIAKRNARANKCKINFINKDMFKYNLINKYDVIISNPPYICDGDEVDPKTKYEPASALYAGADGLKYYHQIFKIAKNALNDKHLLALEIGEEQSKMLKEIAKTFFPRDTIKVEKDLAGKDRYLFVYSE